MYMYIDERKRSVGVYIYTQIQVGVKMTISIVWYRVKILYTITPIIWKFGTV